MAKKAPRLSFKYSWVGDNLVLVRVEKDKEAPKSFTVRVFSGDFAAKIERARQVADGTARPRETHPMDRSGVGSEGAPEPR